MSAVTITSFGYLHGPAPQAHVVLDLREHFRDPHVSPQLRELTAADHAVVVAVMRTPGAIHLVLHIAQTARAFLSGGAPGLVIAVGCAGGRHRSAVIAGEAAWLLRAEGIAVTVTHRDIRRPVIARPAAGPVLPETGELP